MKAVVWRGTGDIRVEEVPDPKLENPTDAIVRITHSCICGSDLWPYKNREATPEGGRIGHEFIGVVEEVGSDISRLKEGDVVVAPFFYADGTCEYCRAGLTTACPNGSAWGAETDGGQDRDRQGGAGMKRAHGLLLLKPANGGSAGLNGR